MQPIKISCFQKKALGRQLEEVKAYRKQFEMQDDSLRSFKPERSDSPITPKVHLIKSDSDQFANARAEDGEGLLMPARMHSEIVPLINYEMLD